MLDLSPRKAPQRGGVSGLGLNNVAMRTNNVLSACKSSSVSCRLVAGRVTAILHSK